MIDRAHDGDEPARNTEWSWVADAYRETPEPRAEAIDETVAAVAAVVARRRSAARRPLWWIAGIAAAIAIAVFGWRRMAPRPPMPLSDVGPQQAPAVPVSPKQAPPTFDSGARPARTPPSLVHPPAAPPGDFAVQQPPAPSHPSIDARNEPAAPADSAPAVPAAPVAVAIAGVSDAELTRLRAGLGDKGLRSFAELVRNATDAGLPTAPLLDRALAGLAHGASPSVILTTVGRRASALRRARSALAVDATAAEVTAGADALEGGVGVAQLAEMQRHFPRGRSTAGLIALAGLVADGVPASAAVDALTRGIDAGASDATLLSWRAEVMADVARGVTPLAALQVQVDRLGHSGVPDRGVTPADRNPTPAPTPPPPIDLPRSP